MVADRMEEVRRLCARYGVERLYLFGSALSDDFSSDSDLDFLVELPDAHYTIYGRNYWGLWRGLHDLFDRKVDLVDQSAVDNPFFLEELEETKLIIYDARSGAFRAGCSRTHFGGGDG